MFCAQYWFMQNQIFSSGIGAIYAALARVSSRPRYAFLVLQLVTEAANTKGRAGPHVRSGEGSMLLRDWLSTQLLLMSERDGRRATLRRRVTDILSDRLTGDPAHDQPLIESAVEDQVLTVGRANVSRAISDLVKAGLLTRHYAGYATNHCNRGAGRHAVYVLCPKTMLIFGRALPGPMTVSATTAIHQLDLFATQ
jgi:hypothetical protein